MHDERLTTVEAKSIIFNKGGFKALLKKEQIQNNPELHKKMTEASRSNARKKYTRPTFCAYKDIECTDKIGEWDFISDCEKDLVALHLFPNTNSKINEVLKGERKHTHGIYFKYKE